MKGDLTNVGSMDEYHQALDMLKKIDAPVKLVIAGNHDRTLDKEWMKRNPFNLDLSLDERKAVWQQATDLWFAKDGRAVREGVQMLEEGTHLIHLKNGAQLRVLMTFYSNCIWYKPMNIRY